jgi:hypothetical protein
MDNVSGIGDGAPDGWVLEEYEVPMPGGLGEILDAIKAVLRLGRVQSLELQMDKPIRYTRLVKESEATQDRVVKETGAMQLGEVARNVTMEEYSGTKKAPTEIFFDLLLAMTSRRLHLSFIGVGANTRMFSWMGLDSIAYGGIERIGGARLVRDGSIPDDNLILFGSPHNNARIDQLTYAIKAQMFMEEDLEKDDE